MVSNDKLVPSASDEYESSFIRDHRERYSQLTGDHPAEKRGHVYMIIKMKDLSGFIIDLEKIKNGIGFKIILKRNINDRALFRVIAGANAVANDCYLDIRDITWCMPCNWS